MQEGGHICGGAPYQTKFKIGATIANVGVPVIDGTAGVIPCTTTDAADTPGLGLDTAAYTTTQATLLTQGNEYFVTVSRRPDLIIRARMSGAATDGTALTTLTNTAASAGGTTITDAGEVGTASMATGTIWCTGGNNKGQSRIITTFNSASDEVVTVPFTRAIAVGDTFHQCPWAKEPGAGAGNVQATTLFTEADALIVAGTGLVATVVDLEMNGPLDSYVTFILADHVFGAVTL